MLRVDANGTITKVAGTSTAGFSGDGGPATAAQLDGPYGVAIDHQGAVYIADLHNQRIRRVDPSGRISTVAGTGTAGFSGDGKQATDATLNDPLRVAVDADGSIYITDRGNQRIRRVDAAGIIETVAGNGSRGFSGDGGSAILAQLNDPSYVEPLEEGAFLIADHLNNRVRHVDSSGVITTYLGGEPDEGHEGATAVRFDGVMGVAVAPAGNIFVSESNRHRIRRLSAQ